MVEYVKVYFINGEHEVYRRYCYPDSADMDFLMNEGTEFLKFKGSIDILKDDRNLYVIRKSDISRVVVFSELEGIV